MAVFEFAGRTAWAGLISTNARTRFTHMHPLQLAGGGEQCTRQYGQSNTSPTARGKIGKGVRQNSHQNLR
jgi:hypothetical protein